MALGQLAFKTLETQGYNVKWNEYVMQHNVCMPEVQDIAAFISEQLA
jgi:phospholipase/carboxylesterase